MGLAGLGAEAEFGMAAGAVDWLVRSDGRDSVEAGLITIELAIEEIERC